MKKGNFAFFLAGNNRDGALQPQNMASPIIDASVPSRPWSVAPW
jgi:hypothetical protein